MSGRSPLHPLATPLVRCNLCRIRSRALFQVVTDDYLNKAQQYRTGQYSLSSKSHLYREGETGEHAYTLFDGWVLLYRPAKDGSRQGLRVALPGNFIGYRARTQDHFNHSALALTDCTLCAFNQRDLSELLQDQGNLAMRLLEIQTRDIAACQSHMLGLGRKRAEGRIAFLVLELYHRLRKRDMHDGTNIPFPLTQEVIGDLAGLTIVHTNRVMQRFRAEGLLECRGKRLRILDEAALAEVADFDPDALDPPATQEP